VASGRLTLVAMGRTVDRPLPALASAITEAKQHAGLSQREIGRRIGVDQTVVSTWVRGTATPSVERIVALDRLFGLRPGTLLERAGLVEPRTTEEAISAEPAIAVGDKNLLQAMVAARRRTAGGDAPAPIDDLFLLDRARLQEAVDHAVHQALAVRRPASGVGAGAGTGRRHRRHTNGG
jgi:transcriptional regulator with XRE-family HTH domain